MDQSKKEFEEFFVVKKPDKTSIKARFSYSGLEKIGYVFSYFIPSIIVFYLPINVFLKVILVISLFILTRRAIKRYLAFTILTIDEQQKLLKLELEAFTVPTREIRDITVEEAPLPTVDLSNYKLKLHLKNGDKTSEFAFSTYDKADSLVTFLKSQIADKSSS